MPDAISETLAVEEERLDRAWGQLTSLLAERFGENLGIEGILFLVGVQSEGGGYQPRLRKERKQDLIMEGTHCVLETLGIYERISDESHELWTRRLALPELSIEQQEKLLRVAIIRYFSSRLGLDVSGLFSS